MSEEQPPSYSERRSFPRHPLEVDIGFFSESNFYSGLTQDISEGGLFVATRQVLPMGTEVSVTFTLPGVREIRADGIVAWLRDPVQGDPGMGIKFSHLEAEDRALIQRFIAKRAPLYHEEY